MNLITSSLILFIALTFILWSKPKEFRFFSASQKNIMFDRANGRCEICNVKLVPFKGRSESMEADHKKPFVLMGKTILSNSLCLCHACNRAKGSFYDKDIRIIFDYVLKKRGI